MNKDTLCEIFDLLFPFKLKEDEFIEIDYDQGDKNFSRALHVKSLEEFLERSKPLSGANFAIHYTTKRISPNHEKFCRRLGKDFAYRAKCIVLDIEDSNNHKGVKEEERVLNWIKVAMNSLDEDIRNAVALATYTGGGGQIYVVFDRELEGRDIEKAVEFFKTFCRSSFIDRSSLNVAQGQRLIGTINQKYKVQTKILKRFSEVKPLNFDMIKDWWEGKEQVSLEENERFKEYKGAITNLRDVIDEIKKKVKFEDILGEPQRRGTSYSAFLCPFHDEGNPSFVVYHNEDGDLAIDYHTGSYYDIIEFYRKYEDISFTESISRLAKVAGVKVKRNKEALKKLELMEEMKKFDPEEHLKDNLGILDFKLMYENGKLIVILKVQDLLDNERQLEIPFTKFRNQKATLNEIEAVVGKVLTPIKRELWEVLVEYVMSRKDKVVKGDVGWEEELKDLIIDLVTRRWGTTQDLSEAVRSFKVFIDQRGRRYVHLPGILQDVNTLFPDVNLKTLTRILRQMGFKSASPEASSTRRRMWLLPKELYLNTSNAKTESFEKKEGGIEKQSDTCSECSVCAENSKRRWCNGAF